MNNKPIQTLTCCCCGEYTKGRQWFNRDKGYGLCPECAIWLSDKETPEEMRKCYGIKGEHYCINKVKLSPERAHEIILLAQQKAECFPWVELIDPKYGIITKEEYKAVKEYWNTLPGHTCFMDAFNKIAGGEAYQ